MYNVRIGCKIYTVHRQRDVISNRNDTSFLPLTWPEFEPRRLWNSFSDRQNTHSETACAIQDHDKDLNGTSRAYGEYFAPSFFHSSRQPFLISRHRISEETRYLYPNACLRKLWCRDDRWLSFAYTRSYRHSVRFLRSIKDNDQKHATRPTLSIGSRSAAVQRREPGPRPTLYPIRRLIVRSREVSKPREWQF